MKTRSRGSLSALAPGAALLALAPAPAPGAGAQLPGITGIEAGRPAAAG